MKTKIYNVPEPTRVEQIAFMKANYPKVDNSAIIKQLGINKSYFYRLVGKVTTAVHAA